MMDTPEWNHLVRLVETIGYGELRLVIQNGKPVRVEVAVKTIKLDDKEDFKGKLGMMQL